MNQFRYQLENAMVDLFVRVSIGAAGAPTLSTTYAKGVASISRSAAGRYVITLQDKYNNLMGIECSFLIAGIPAAPIASIFADNVAASGALTIQCADAAGAAADPANGEVMLLKISLKNSSV
jgi:hypothetical protein